MVIFVKEGQTLIDIAIQYLGDSSGAILIANLNKLSLTDTLEIGQKLSMPNTLNKRVAAYFDTFQYVPASSSNELQTGIDYDIIEFNLEIA